MFIIIISTLIAMLVAVNYLAWTLRKRLSRLDQLLAAANQRGAAVSGLLVGVARTYKKSGQFTVPAGVVKAIPDWAIQSKPNPNGSIKVTVVKAGK